MTPVATVQGPEAQGSLLTGLLRGWGWGGVPTCPLPPFPHILKPDYPNPVNSVSCSHLIEFDFRLGYLACSWRLCSITPIGPDAHRMNVAPTAAAPHGLCQSRRPGPGLSGHREIKREGRRKVGKPHLTQNIRPQGLP